MRLAFALLLTAVALGAVVEVRNGLGFPIPNATVCFQGRCVSTNASGVAVVPLGAEVEIYVGGLLTWKTYSSGHDVVTVSDIDHVSISPVNASGYVVLKIVKFLNGTYGELKIPFSNNKLERAIPVGGVDYPVEIYLTEVGGVRLRNATVVRRDLWNMGADLLALGLVERCTIASLSPVTRIAILQGNTTVASGAANVTAYLPRGASYLGVAETRVLLPNGDFYRAEFNPLLYCGRTIVVNASRLVIRAVDSFGVTRTDWTIYVAGRAYKGQAELWILPHDIYTVAVDAGFARRNLTVAASNPTEVLTVEVENAYLIFNYQQPVDKVYIVGNYTTVAQIPRRVELPPGTYKVYVEAGGRNSTYIVTLRPGETVQLTITPAKQGRGQEQTEAPTSYAFAGVVSAMALAALVAVAIGIRRRQRQGRGR
ncbi:hypothetical protein [Pyrobaculum neutrophilum]|uniref:Uncharacterized protein n=1 Tax=Pyrobaculum neutrophilum (strain DSM 2338 / JCM 9278 / NBRC 100436 / V24Sta) TaxID=444157 RepID=B1YCT9_PYRNV|nr:hypothetical protein [Pyrobaculum neutrophilum]ACB39602.1 conserved hypothetical protein [Pyrobaculum neutrophilum V24Sta]